MAHSRSAQAQSVPVLLAAHMKATDGANMGDGLSFASDLVLDDVYELLPGSEPVRLSVAATSEKTFRVAENTATGDPGAKIVFDSTLMFMSPDGTTQEALLLVEVDGDGGAAGVYLLPLVPLIPRTEYRLVGIDTDNQLRKFAEVACVSFTRGTHITLGSGKQCRIEDLRVGDRVLTRDDGVQPIRWIGQGTVRALGDMAPIRIAADTLNNANDLIVSPEHRLFIYQRTDEVGVGRSELLVKARHLINGDTVSVQDGGFVDYFQLLFDSHQIIYAEGIAAESMLIDTRTKAVLPDDLAAVMGEVIPGHTDLPHAGLDVHEQLLDRPDAADLLRKASTR
ncbi:Hint domain-containing protein [Sulfitobacter aestuariivivens]|uniref:Hint domain-containing protein n=1 Tax=Sulfitobacter aestuariivivens TaxID=2766981 RepID=A0A927D501_9RHOB|nr:Hint domain-containing protein [Sulfitobacter aestuariivivens]MBD3663542.1 Hint domain-containing protein [Sulfitobacter aestuariivivens]